jgi:glycogen debranching enzyme
MNFDLRYVPFSRYGSYLAFSCFDARGDEPGGLYLRTVHGGFNIGALGGQIARVELLSGALPVPFSVEATPACLRLKGEAGQLEICLPEPSVIRLRGTGVGAWLSVDPAMYDYAFPAGGGRWQVNRASRELQFMLTPLAGQWRVEVPWKIVNADRIVADLVPEAGTGTCEGAIEEFAGTWHPRPYSADFDTCLQSVQAEFQRWLDHMPDLPAPYAEARELAAYVNWSSVVAAQGHLARPAMYMSKNWMTNVWSWDHCFNALALVYKDPALAWDQLMLLFDVQDGNGALPDSVNDKRMLWNFCKPPIHGWTLRRMMERTDTGRLESLPHFITVERLREIYEPLCRWTDWWFTFRDYDEDGIPQYNHGNDSGWDNATVFHVGMPVEGPDLSAFLVIQMEVLSEVTARLGDEVAARAWQRRAEGLLARMLDHFWRGDHFVATRSGDHYVCEEGDSLFLFLPLILGRRLPTDVRKALVNGLTQPGRFITGHGLATESPRSPLYEPDGYWRGPIWAPSTMLLVEGLAACGENQLARELCRRFCAMAARSGMAENFDALTGQGLRDRAYTWTSSVFLVLGHEGNSGTRINADEHG